MLHGMEASDVLDLLSALDDHGMRALQRTGRWIGEHVVSTTGLTADGVVDCLLGEETRAHSDLDLVLARLNVD